jgi:hypothetical protein
MVTIKRTTVSQNCVGFICPPILADGLRMSIGQQRVVNQCRNGFNLCYRMNEHIPSMDTMNSIMVLAAGVLGFLAAVTPIINNKLQKAKTPTAKEKIIEGIFGWIYGGLSVSGFVLLIFGWPVTSLWLYIIGGFVYAINFLRRQKPPSRLEIFTLGFWFFFALIGTMTVAAQRMTVAAEQAKEIDVDIDKRLDRIYSASTNNMEQIEGFSNVLNNTEVNTRGFGRRLERIEAKLKMTDNTNSALSR